jgi:hypothetical protein
MEYNPPKSDSAKLVETPVPGAPIVAEGEGVIAIADVDGDGVEGVAAAVAAAGGEGAEGVKPPLVLAGSKTPEQIAADDAATEERILKGILAKAGIKDIAELNARLAPPAPIETPEAKIEREENERAAIMQYGVKAKKFTTDEYSTLQNLKKLPTSELAYNDFNTEYRNQYKDRKDEGGTGVPVTDQEVQEAFNDFYHLDSDNKVIKDRGLELVDKKGKELLAELDGKISEATEEYHYIAERDDFMKKTFRPFLKTAIAAIPAEITYGEGDNKVVIQTTPFDKSEIEKMFASDPVFESFFDAKGGQKAQDIIKQQITDQLIIKNIKTIIETARSVGEGQGIKKAKVGPEAPFTPPVAKGLGGEIATPGKLSEKTVADTAKYYGRD